MAKDNRVPLMMSSEELEAIDDYRFQNRIASRAEAIRCLCRDQLANLSGQQA